MRVGFQSACCVACLLWAILAPIPAAFGEEVGEGVKSDLKARELIRRVAEFYGGLDTVVVEATLSLKGAKEGEKPEAMSNTFSIAMRRPKQFAMAAKGDAIEMTVISDGDDLYTYDPQENEYTLEAAPDTLASILGLSGSGVVRVGTMIMAELFRDEPYKILVGQVQAQHYLGEEEVNGAKYHHVRFVHDEIDWEMWIDAGEKPLVSKVAVDISKVLKNIGAGQMRIDMGITYKGWVINGELSDDTFTFVPPEGAQKVEPFQPQRGPDALRGKPAPGFTLELLNGGTLELAEHKGKHIVILDFWASWCGPCRHAMPIYTKIAEEYKDKGVLFYGVNLGEAPEVAREFLEKTGITCAVALDSNGAVANQYGVVSIPMTVIVGKDGTVQAVYIGFAPNLETKVKRELDALINKG